MADRNLSWPVATATLSEFPEQATKKHPLLQMDTKAAARRAATIRRQNVQRHHKAAAVQKLRHELQRHTANRNAQMELGRLQEASLRHNGLDRAGLARMNELLSVVK
jgi:hypothetical protein